MVSNKLLGLLNILTLLLSIPILGAGIWLANRASSDCEKFLERPVIALGVFLMLVSLAGLVGACCRVSWLLSIYLFVMFVLIVLAFCFTIVSFAFVAVTNKGAGAAGSGRGFKECPRLGNYSNWLQKRVSNGKNWARIRSCLQDGKVCKCLQQTNETLDNFKQENLSPIQSGCCMPPTECNFSYEGPTRWSGTSNSSNPDCTTWKKDQTLLCYDCQSCKAGVLDNLKKGGKKVAAINFVFFIIVTIVYLVGCCASRNNRRDNRQPKSEGYP